ncbi:hypothetical protein TNIN_349821 [Trichonephila inaurata madagascariensis]|uniref:Uncharacterized protein n=1 Tax=Trichonephila inaurata madagascariensis TaxID=2747483 RepID=A0A8X7BNZ5_9ARAC|nr:hypothetical protein TNIN_349821 [Trichonephila inaurata madagascariensis]
MRSVGKLNSYTRNKPYYFLRIFDRFLQFTIEIAKKTSPIDNSIFTKDASTTLRCLVTWQIAYVPETAVCGYRINAYLLTRLATPCRPSIRSLESTPQLI